MFFYDIEWKKRQNDFILFYVSYYKDRFLDEYLPISYSINVIDVFKKMPQVFATNFKSIYVFYFLYIEYYKYTFLAYVHTYSYFHLFFQALVVFYYQNTID